MRSPRFLCCWPDDSTYSPMRRARGLRRLILSVALAGVIAGVTYSVGATSPVPRAGGVIAPSASAGSAPIAVPQGRGGPAQSPGAAPILGTPAPRTTALANASTATAPPSVAKTPSATPQPIAAPLHKGVSLAGADFAEDVLPGTLGKDYTYPTLAELDYYHGKGINIIRLPFRWERVQTARYAPLDATNIGQIDGLMQGTGRRGMTIILDMHNYDRYFGGLVGQDVPDAALADVWGRLATRYAGASNILYGIMNEPHDTNGHWPATAQAAVGAIRRADTRHTILVSGDCWAGASSWQRCNDDLAVQDPANNVVYEAHVYFDADGSGRYPAGYDQGGAYPAIGVDRVQPFLSWLRTHNARGFLGEYGVPGNDPRWLTVLDNFFGALDTAGVGGTYWAGGPWWGDYPLSVEPVDGQDRTQMSVLVRHVS